MTREAEMWEAKVGELNQLHTELQNKPDHLKRGFNLAPGGILNAYREGDLSFHEAVKLLRVDEAVEGKITEWADRPVVLILKALKLIRGQLVLIGNEPYLHADVIDPPMEELNETLQKLEAVC